MNSLWKLFMLTIAAVHYKAITEVKAWKEAIERLWSVGI